jgi:heparan-alpha-glucosaminide N-acetyltransferase
MKNLTLQRVAAVDVFRALTMFLMLFVNDIPGLKNVPHWLMHAAADEDMLGFSDTIFPAFLFCMGMSVSFAIQNRYKKGDTTTQVIAHIFWRTVALIAMGLFSLNSGGIEGGLSHSWFTILMVIGFFLTWGVYPKAEGTKKALFTVMKVAGVVLLATLVILEFNL